LALSGVDVGGHGGARRVAAAHADEGWRASLYGVYDGHAGSAAAHWLRARLSGAIAAQLRAAAGLGGAGGADGAGGAGGGGARKRAARRRRPLSLAHARGALERAFASVDAELLAHEGACESGSCAAVALVCGAHVLTAHVGDCRVVLWRDGVAVPLTSDHRAAAPFEKARIEARGGFVAFDRVVGQLAVARAFGDRSFKRLDVSGGGGAAPRIEELVSAVPDVACVRWLPGDFLLLACDGVWDVLSDQEVRAPRRAHPLRAWRPRTRSARAPAHRVGPARERVRDRERRQRDRRRAGHAAPLTARPPRALLRSRRRPTCSCARTRRARAAAAAATCNSPSSSSCTRSSTTGARRTTSPRSASRSTRGERSRPGDEELTAAMILIVNTKSSIEMMTQ
jgi:serine/threonine protein phosphatase PrpC